MQWNLLIIFGYIFEFVFNVYSYKGLVAEALRQLVGEHGYKQDEVLPPGYYTGRDKLLLNYDTFAQTKVGVI